MMTNTQKTAVQKEAFPLAGMSKVVKFFSPNRIANLLSIVKVFSAYEFDGILTNPNVRNLSKPDTNATYLDVQNLSKLVIETALDGIYATVRAREEGFSIIRMFEKNRKV